jgi:hypothetical protein
MKNSFDYDVSARQLDKTNCFNESRQEIAPGEGKPMQSKAIRSRALSCAVSALAIALPMLMSTAAYAEDAPAATPADQAAAPEIIVTGIRASVERAISIKRNAPNVVDAISAQDIGKLPDATISDSLQRIPGVQIRRDAGEGSTVNVRGLPQVVTLMNGDPSWAPGRSPRSSPALPTSPPRSFPGPASSSPRPPRCSRRVFRARSTSRPAAPST